MSHVEGGLVTVHDKEPMECAADPAQGSALASAQQVLLGWEPLVGQRSARATKPARRIGEASPRTRTWA